MAKSVQTLILDIDSGTVGACVLTQGAERPEISLVKRVPVGTGVVREAGAMIPQLKEALTTLLADYKAVHPKNVLVVFASPWFTANLRTLSSKSDKPVRVTAATVARVVTDYKKSDHTAGHMLESVPVTVSVNGYHTKVTKPVMGKTLAVTLYESAADAACVDAVTTAVHTVAPHAHILWHTTPLVYAEAVMSLTGREYLTVVDVGSELTDLVLLSRGTIGFVGSVPEGARSVARAVATATQKTDAGVADSASRLVMLARNELSEKEMQTTAAALNDAAKSWQQSFEQVVQTAGNTIPVPHQVLVIGENDELTWFTRVVDGAANPSGSSQKKHDAERVSPDFFAGSLGFGEGGVYDASLALSALFFHIRHHTTQKQNEKRYESVVYSVQ